MFSGDLDNDGIVDVTDVLRIYNDRLIMGNVLSDINGDDIVDTSDLINAYNNMVAVARVRRP